MQLLCCQNGLNSGQHLSRIFKFPNLVESVSAPLKFLSFKESFEILNLFRRIFLILFQIKSFISYCIRALFFVYFQNKDFQRAVW